MGSSSMGGIGLPATPGAMPSFADQDVQLARGSALRQISAKRGLASTFLTTGGSLNDTPTAAPTSVLGAKAPLRFPSTSVSASMPAGLSLSDMQRKRMSVLGSAAPASGSSSGPSLLGSTYSGGVRKTTNAQPIFGGRKL